MIQARYICRAVYFYYCYISSISDRPITRSQKLRTPALGNVYTCNHVVFVILCLPYFIQPDVLKVHSYCSRCQNFLPFLHWRMFHCVYRPHFGYLLIHRWTFGSLPLLAVMNHTAVNLGAHLIFRMQMPVVIYPTGVSRGWNDTIHLSCLARSLTHEKMS